MNDFIRDKMTDKHGRIEFWGEVVAGGSVSLVVPLKSVCHKINQLMFFEFDPN